MFSYRACLFNRWRVHLHCFCQTQTHTFVFNLSSLALRNFDFCLCKVYTRVEKMGEGIITYNLTNITKIK